MPPLLVLVVLCLTACRTARAALPEGREAAPAQAASSAPPAPRPSASPASVSSAPARPPAGGPRSLSAATRTGGAPVRRGEAVVRQVAPLVGRPSLRGVARGLPDDCTGLVRLGYRGAGVELRGEGRRGENGVSALHRRAKRLGALHRGRPRAGDLVFFRETYDRNGDGRRNDGLTHVGVVEAVAPDGTVSFIHRSNTGVIRSRLNLRFPLARRAPGGAVLNDGMRRAAPGSRGRLAGELFAGYASAEALLGRPAGTGARRVRRVDSRGR